MTSEIKILYDELLKIRKYLVKVGPKRRKGVLIEKELRKTNELLDQYNSRIETFSELIKSGHISPESLLKFESLCKKWTKTYNEILSLCPVEAKEKIESEDCSETSNSDSFSSLTSEKSETMEGFNLKTACSLLPAMTGDEEVTKSLISNIELYETMLKEDDKKFLINFVLKSRLSDSAKIKLSQEYGSVKALTQDMRCYLLTKKSAPSLQNQLQHLKQNSKSIDQFGTNIEKLFVDLTISQSDGKPEVYNILRPLNESMAIQRFADGLRDPRLSTIIAARNYSSLKDAVRAAKDEELASPPSTSGSASSYFAQRGQSGGSQVRGQNRGSHRPYRGNYTYSRGQNSHTQNQLGQNYHWQNHRGGQRGQTFRGGYRGRYNSYHNRGQSAYRDINGGINATQHETDATNRDSSTSDEMNHFFRA